MRHDSMMKRLESIRKDQVQVFIRVEYCNIIIPSESISTKNKNLFSSLFL